jgi:hypothetical protein
MPATKREAKAELILRCSRRIREKKAGFTVLTIILTAALATIVKLVIEHWWERWKKNHPDPPEPEPVP